MMKTKLAAFYISFLLLFEITMAPEAKCQSTLVIDSLSRSLTTVKSEKEKMDLLYNLSEEWAELNFDSAFHYAEVLIKKAQFLNNKEYLIYGLRAKGLAYDYAYELDTAKQYYLKALEEALEVNDTSNIALVYFNLGTLELLKGNYVQVLPWFNQAIEYLENKGDNSKLLVNIYNNLGIVYRRIDRFRDAIRIYQRALDIIDLEKDEYILSDIYINLGNAMISLEEFDSAEIYYLQVYDFAIRKNETLDYAFACTGLGTVEESRGHYQQAKAYFDQAISQKDIDDKNILFTALRYKAEILSNEGRYDSAMYYFDRAFPIYDEAENPDQVKELYLGLAEHYERVGRIHRAIEFYKKYYAIKDLLINQEVIDRTSEWEERLQTQEKETEIVNLKFRNEEASLLAQRQRNQLNIFLFLSIVLVIIIGFSFYMYRLKQRVNISLAEKNMVINKALKDKELLMKEIHHRVKNNLQVVSSLLNLQSNFIIDEKANAAVRESKNRVHSMALIHQRLYQHDDLTKVDLEEYLDQLILNLEQSFHQKDKEIVINLEVDPVMMDVDKVVLLGLIVNELITNSFKYAFEGKTNGRIDISLKDNDGEIILCVADDGRGMPGVPEIKKGSLGTLLINDLSKKLNAEIEYHLESGTSVTLRFKYPRKYL